MLALDEIYRDFRDITVAGAPAVHLNVARKVMRKIEEVEQECTAQGYNVDALLDGLIARLLPGKSLGGIRQLVTN